MSPQDEHQKARAIPCPARHFAARTTHTADCLAVPSQQRRPALQVAPQPRPVQEKSHLNSHRNPANAKKGRTATRAAPPREHELRRGCVARVAPRSMLQDNAVNTQGDGIAGPDATA